MVVLITVVAAGMRRRKEEIIRTGSDVESDGRGRRIGLI